MPQTTITLGHPIDFARWRSATRALVGQHVPPGDITWHVAPPGPPDTSEPALASPPFRIPRETMQLAADVLQSMLPDRFTLAYHLIYAHATGTEIPSPELARMEDVAQAVRAETVHLRHDLFTLMQRGDGHDAWNATLDAATHAPECNARFMTFQLSLAPWRLALPGRGMEWTGEKLLYGQDGTAPAPIAFGSLPPPAMPLVNGLDISRITALPAVALAARTCRICPMARHATQTVFGEGRSDARMMFVGEQPGDKEDLAGRPFVGPAGQLFDRALLEAGIARDDTYVTNTVKHFKFRPRGTRRIHEKAGPEEIASCAPWLAAERRIIRPHVLVMLGATAASALLGRPVTIGRERSRAITLADGTTGVVTVHPSFLLRVPDEAARVREYDRFVADLKLAASLRAPTAP